jgi:transcriptional regulator with XRE-family HTH domain
MSFGQHLRTLRAGAGLSRPELARRAGVPVGTLRNWEGGRGMPGLSARLRLPTALGVRVERFAEGVEDPEEVEAETVEPPQRNSTEQSALRSGSNTARNNTRGWC